jgi:hypothetical protein
MALRPLRTTLAAGMAALALATGLSACGEESGSLSKPSREGLAIPVAGVDYNIFITRELNLAIQPDRAYYKGPPAPPGKVLYGVFLQACSHSKKRVRTLNTRNFLVEDNQGNKYYPKELPKDDAFAYQPAMVSEEQCIPQPGSVAQQGPTAGAMLLYEFPLQNTENRPLQMHIQGPYDLIKGKRESKILDLDL